MDHEIEEKKMLESEEGAEEKAAMGTVNVERV